MKQCDKSLIFFVMSIVRWNLKIFVYAHLGPIFQSGVRLFSSPEPKAQVSFSDQNLSVVRRCRHCCRCRCCCCHCCRKLCSNEGPCPSPRGDNYEIVKIHWRNLKIFLSRTTGPISTQLGTKHPCVKGT